MRVDLVRTQTSDGIRLDGALHEADSMPGSTLDAMLCLSGVGSNFYGSILIERACQRLVEHGIAALRVNTRGHDGVSTASVTFGSKLQGAAYEIIDDCRYDIAAWIRFLSQQGFARIGLLGHSLGAIKVIYSQAKAADEAVRRVIAISPPSLSHQRFLRGQNATAFQRSWHRAEELIAQGTPEMLFQASFPFPLIISPSTYVDKYGPSDRYDITRFANQLACPLTFIYGGAELTAENSAFSGLTDELDRLPWSAARRPTICVIPAANHFYSGALPQLLDEISRAVID